MFITPIEPIQIDTVGAVAPGKQGAGKSATGIDSSNIFGDIFKSVWDTATVTSRDLAEKQYLQSIGEIDDTHTVPIAAKKAELSVSLLVNLRNKALDSYNEIIRMSV